MVAVWRWVFAACVVPGLACAAPADRFSVAGVSLGMKLSEALAAMTQTFAEEGLPNVQLVDWQSHPAKIVAAPPVLRLVISQTASAPGLGYRSDRFRLLFAGPPSDQRLTGLSRDYVAPTAIDRAAVIHNLIAKYGPPSESTVPDASVAPNSAQLVWLITPGGGLAGAGAQSSASLECMNGLSSYEDYFANDPDTAVRALSEIAARQRAGGCGLVLQVGYAGNSVHYMMYDTTIALRALAPAKGAATVAGAVVAASPSFKY